MKKIAISCALGMAFVAYSFASAAQCTVDTDCKGNRICQGGQCVDAAPAPTPAPAPATATATAYSTSTAAPAPAGGFKPFVVGAYMSMGMAHAIIDWGDADGNDPKPRFAGGGGAYIDYYVIEMLALEGGISFIGKGAWDEDHDTKVWDRIIYMEIPLGAKLNIKGFQASLTIGLEFALSGKSTIKVDDEKSSHTWGDDEWDNYRRFNLCPRITLGYAIPVGPVAIVPGITWMIEVINTVKGDAADDFHVKLHNMNLMFNLGLEFGFGA